MTFLLFEHVTDNLSESNFHAKLEDEISALSSLSAMLEIL